MTKDKREMTKKTKTIWTIALIIKVCWEAQVNKSKRSDCLPGFHTNGRYETELWEKKAENKQVSG